MNFIDYFQVISLFAFFSVFLGRSIWLKRKGTTVFVIGNGKKGFADLLEKSFLIFFPIWLIEICIHALNLGFQFLPMFLVKPILNSQIIQFTGAIVISIGLVVFFLSLISFKSSWRVGIDTTSPGDLITSGIFSLSRNPIFLSMDLYFLGTFFIYSNLFFLLSFVCMVLGFHFQIRQEEMFLIKKYGDEYSNYMAQVNRYI